MYEDHYGLSGRPFQLTPDPRFWYETATHRKAMAYLGYGLAQGEGFIVISGDIGAGKTTLVGHLMASVDREQLHVVRIVSTQIEPEDLLRQVAAGMEIDGEGLSKAALLQAIERAIFAYARAGKRTLLIVDEVQALPLTSLEELRMLSNFQAGGHALLQIFLLGQPEFREALQDPRLEQVRQRVIAMHHLGPMEAREVDAYLAHRLALVGWQGNPDFDAEAVAAMYAWSGGIPRRLNQLASRMLLHGAIEGIARFGAADVQVVADDLAGVTHVAVDEDIDGDVDGGQAELMLDAAIVADEPATEVREAPAVAEPVEWPIARDAPEIEGLPRPILADAPIPEDITVAPVAPVAPVTPVEPIVVAEPAASTDPDIIARIERVERLLEEQDAALRRVLTLLVDWVEVGGGPQGGAEEENPEARRA